MDEYTSPALVEKRSSGNLSDITVTNAEEAPDAVVLARRSGDEWVDVTCAEFRTAVTGVAKGLLAAGVEAGDRVALMSRTRYEWTLVDFAIWHAGAVTVPVYETSSPEQLRWILEDSRAVACVVETPDHERTLGDVRSDLPHLRHAWVIDSGAIDELAAAGSDVPDADLDRRRATAGPDDVATIVYTSGTTGRPKGCELTHGNFLFELENVVSMKDSDSTLGQVFQDDDASTLLFLPLAHVFARIIQVGVVMARGKLGHTPDVKQLLDDLASFRPTFLLSVPRVFEKVYSSSERKAEAAGRGKIFAAAAETAVAYSEALDTGGPGFALRLKHAVFDKLVYAKMRAALGGRVSWAVSGGAPLGLRLGHFYRGMGLPVLEGYGLTETTAASTVNTPGQMKLGTVGRPLPGVSVRVAADGEVQIKGAHVFAGYHGNSAATAETTTEDGWLRTGDLGVLDDDGFLRITGRSKEIIVTAGGKNVAPGVLEDRLRAHRLVSQCMVVGDGKPYVACLVTLDEEALPAWLEQRGKQAMSVAEAAEDPDVRAAVQQAVDDANAAVSKAESIKRFTILPIDFTEDNGALTPSLKLKRAAVLKDFATDVDELYA